MDVATVLSAALLATTIIYAFLTWSMAKASRDAAAASRDAANAAKSAAESSQASAWVAEAQLPVTFEVQVDRHRTGPVWFTLKPRVNMWIHCANIKCSVMATDRIESTTFHSAELRLPHGGQFPVFVYGDSEGTSFEWPEPSYRATDFGVHGFLSIQYSLAEESPVRDRAIFFESAPGLGRRALKTAGIIESVRPGAPEESP